MEEKLKKVKDLLEKNNQKHLLKRFEKLDDKRKEMLLDDILSIDFDQIDELYKDVHKVFKYDNNTIQPIEYVDKYKLDKDIYEEYEKEGLKIIKNGELAAVTMAGGQGTRLGHSGPKGTYDIGLDSHKSIFEILCDTLKLAYEKYGVYVPWYIMTSKENNQATVDFFEKNNYFGYPKDKIMFFKQGKLPMVGEDGKILLDENGMIKLAADGHGGVFESMSKENVISDMKKKGIKWVFIGGVDNVLVKMVDPIILGLATLKKVPAAGKSVVKANPAEKVGVFCKRNNRPSVVEYSEISQEMAELVDDNGELVYGESHILCNLFSLDAIEKISKNKLPYHSAHKKAKYIDENDNIVEPEEPNAYKFEAFLFDAFESLEDMAILRVKREEEFAPVKNAKDVDCPETARKLYMDFFGLN